MPYAPDLSKDYDHLHFSRPGTKTVGWLDAKHPFPRAAPTEELLDLLWLFCTASVAETRGFHLCEFCPGDLSPNYAERNSQRLLLGTSEIRIFSPDGTIYTAPTLIYHYVGAHHYQPPEEFLHALHQGPRPPSQEYFSRLEAMGFEWQMTSWGE